MYSVSTVAILDMVLYLCGVHSQEQYTLSELLIPTSSLEFSRILVCRFKTRMSLEEREAEDFLPSKVLSMQISTTLYE